MLRSALKMQIMLCSGPLSKLLQLRTGYPNSNYTTTSRSLYLLYAYLNIFIVCVLELNMKSVQRELMLHFNIIAKTVVGNMPQCS